ncbi:hypothetical protein ACWCXB_19585 [Streptomyces sp. NPDC001514]
MPEEVVYEEPGLRMEAEPGPRAELRLDPATDTERLLEGGLRADLGDQARIAPEIQWEPQTRQMTAREEPLVTRAEALEPQVRQVAAEPHVRQVAAEPQARQVAAEPMTRRLEGRAEPMTERAVAQEPSSGFVSRTAEEPQVRARRAEDGETRRATRLDEDDDERRERRRAAGEPQQRSVAAAQPRRQSRGPNGEVTLTTKDDELIVIVPSQMRRAVPRFEEVAQRMARLGSDVQFVTDEPIEGDPSNETYKAITEALKDAPKVIKGFGDIAEGIGNIGQAVEGMASVGEKAEQHAQETMDDLDKSLPTFGDVGPIGSTSGGRGKR